MYEFKLPDLGEGIAEGEILKWHVELGGRAVEDEPLVDVETDKAAVTITSPVSGSVSALNAKVGDVVNVGNVLVVIDAEGTPEATAGAEPGVACKVPDESASAELSEDISKRRSRRRPVPATPATRRLARELGIDINLVSPTGPGGRVTADDVNRFVAQPASSATPEISEHVAAKEVADEKAFAEFAAHASSTIPFFELEPLPDFAKEGPVETESLRSIRRKVARKMVTSMTLIPHVAHMDEADVTELEAFRKRERDRRKNGSGGHLTLLPFVVKAITAGLRAAPVFNASLDPFREEIVYKRYYNIGFAADTGRGLVVPVIKGSNNKSIVAISDEIYEKSMLARDGKLPPDDMRGGTFTITNIGPLGGTALVPAINYPEVAILGMGKVQEKPVVRDGEIVIRKILPLTLAFDHRIADGADAARFVAELVRQLSDPHLLLLET